MEELKLEGFDNMQEVKAPTLEIDPSKAAEVKEALQTGKDLKDRYQEELSRMTKEEQTQIMDFSKKIDLANSELILKYGTGAQSKIASFSENTLSKVQTRDLGEIGSLLTKTVSDLKNFDDDDDKGFFSFLRKPKRKIDELRAKYEIADKNIDGVTKALEEHQMRLMKDVALLDNLYATNLEYYKELTMYILAGKERLRVANEEELPALKKKAEETGLAEDAQAARDAADRINRFEKKIHDLELTRAVSMQMAPQLRLVQSNDTLMAEKIQSTLVNTIPLWKSQMVLTLGIQHSNEAAQAQKRVSDFTNELLKKNAEVLKTATITTAKESERGIVDIETLKATNASLISTLDEVMKIQEEGRAKRAQAETELRGIENEVKERLLSISRESSK